MLHARTEHDAASMEKVKNLSGRGIDTKGGGISF